MVNEYSLDVHLVSSVNIFPDTKQEIPTSAPLSIFDNATAGFARCAAVWFYDPSPSGNAISSTHYQLSLSKTLNSYRQWCGRLSYAEPKTSGSHNERHQQIWITYNTPEEIGIPFVTATSPRALLDFLPDT